MLNESQKLELFKRIDEVLYYLWDPIGVSDEPCARSEYSSYVSSIINFVINEDIDELTSKLSNIETQNMGLLVNREKNKLMAIRLIEDKIAIQQGLR